MKLSYYQYKSQYIATQNRWQNKEYSGCLLKLTNDQGISGYTNYHAIQACKDKPVEQVLNGFVENELTETHHLLKQYLLQDLQFRTLKSDALAGAFQLENHYLITDVAMFDRNYISNLVEQHFRIFKIKMGKDINKETNWIKEQASYFIEKKLLLRLDFNEYFDFEAFDFWQSENAFHQQGIIDFYEDPTPYERQYWKKWKELGLRLAKDFTTKDDLSACDGIDVFVLKPAKVNVIEWLKHLKDAKNFQYVITHYLDTPLGVAQAAACALKLKFFVGERLLACGLLPLHMENLPKELQWPLSYRGPHLLFNNDIGLGFSEELGEIDWKDLDCQLAE
ncbi:MAG: hypothetical protein H6625_05970 [Bdellovibrionaceae bacterium]|nr:hypothetical protein [Pseudobdellovibrionaceae bacterium]